MSLLKQVAASLFHFARLARCRQNRVLDDNVMFSITVPTWLVILAFECADGLKQLDFRNGLGIGWFEDPNTRRETGGFHAVTRYRLEF